MTRFPAKWRLSWDKSGTIEGYGMATIVQRKTGWQARVRRHGVTKSETFATRGAAEAWARRMESEIERGLWRDTSEAERTTVAEALARYRDEKTGQKRGAVQEASVIGLLLDDPISRLTLARIRSADVAALVARWKKAGYAPATIKRRLSVLSHVLTTARREWGIECANPVPLLKLPQLNNARERRVTDDEIEAICQATGSRILAAIVRLAVETAMRRSEIVRMRWENVDLRRRVVHLPETKNGHARDVPLSSRAVAILEGLARNIDGRVFDVREDAVTQAFARACQRAGIEDLHFHDLRHEATSRLAERLPGILELSAVTGHKDLRMLKRYYHPRAEELAKKLG